MFGLGYQELLIILVIVLILFGANRLPEAEPKFEAGVALIDRLKAPELAALRTQMLTAWAGALRSKGRSADAEELMARLGNAPDTHAESCGCGHDHHHHGHAHHGHHHEHAHDDHEHGEGCGCGAHAH